MKGEWIRNGQWGPLVGTQKHSTWEAKSRFQSRASLRCNHITRFCALHKAGLSHGRRKEPALAFLQAMHFREMPLFFLWGFQCQPIAFVTWGSGRGPASVWEHSSVFREWWGELHGKLIQDTAPASALGASSTPSSVQSPWAGPLLFPGYPKVAFSI